MGLFFYRSAKCVIPDTVQKAKGVVPALLSALPPNKGVESVRLIAVNRRLTIHPMLIQGFL